MENKIQFNDLSRSYKKIKSEYLKKVTFIHNNSDYINGVEVKKFEENLKKFLNVKNVISCGNGTDALFMSIFCLNLKKNDEVIMPAFSYISAIEVVSILGLKPVLVDIDPNNFNINVKEIVAAISSKTKLIIPVHLFGNNSDMKSIMQIAKKYKLYVVEDAAQSVSSVYTLNNKKFSSGSLGDIGCASFFPTKNLGCFGDGGVMFTNNDKIAKKLRMIRNHGQEKKYVHATLGFNSRLDTIQAAVLNAKLKYLPGENKIRQEIALKYNRGFKEIKNIVTPLATNHSNHVYHQYTIRIKKGLREKLKNYLEQQGIPTMIYYPSPIHHNEPFKKNIKKIGLLKESIKASKEVLSIPIFPYLKSSEINFIIKSIKGFFSER